MQVNANDKTVDSVLASGFYRVPRFQRPYSWDPSNVEDFWDDVTDSGAEYFIGSMVIFKDGDAAGLVDGQQRLTTVTMMLAAIRNEFLTHEDTDAADGIQTLIERKDPKGKLRFALQAESSYPFLQAAIQAMPGTVKTVQPAGAEEGDLKRAFELITSRTRGITASAQAIPGLSEEKQRQRALDDLGKLRDKIYGLTVVLVEVDDEDDATTIFQTLNSRGKDLETADLVKAHLLQMLKSPNAGLDQARDTWDSIRRSFDESAARISVNRFLLHSWLSREEYIGEKDLFKRVKKKIRSNNADAYLSALADDAERYRTAQEPSFRTWTKPQRPAAASLRAIGLFRLQQPLPFVLSVLREYDAKSIKLAVLLRALRGVENFHFLATAVTSQPSSGGISRMYAGAGRAVLQGKGPAEKAKAIDELVDKLRDRIPTYAEFEAAFVELRSSRAFPQQTQLVRYVLDRLQATAPGFDPAAPLDLAQLTVEHLVPQGNKRPKEIAEADLARIGNLLLVTEEINSKLADEPFTEKRKVLKKLSGVDAKIIEATSWESSQILDRSKRLARQAYDVVWKF